GSSGVVVAGIAQLHGRGELRPELRGRLVALVAGVRIIGDACGDVALVAGVPEGGLLCHLTGVAVLAGEPDALFGLLSVLAEGGLPHVAGELLQVALDDDQVAVAGGLEGQDGLVAEVLDLVVVLGELVAGDLRDGGAVGVQTVDVGAHGSPDGSWSVVARRVLEGLDLGGEDALGVDLGSDPLGALLAEHQRTDLAVDDVPAGAEPADAGAVLVAQDRVVTVPRLGAAAEEAGVGFGRGGHDRAPMRSSAPAIRRASPRAIIVLVPADATDVTGPGTAATSRPSSFARRATSSVLERGEASMMTVCSDRAARSWPRRRKFVRLGRVPSSYSLTRRPPAATTAFSRSLVPVRESASRPERRM